jgi:hypothetical protein
LDLRGQSKARQTASRKPRLEVRGHPKFKAYLDELRKSTRDEDIRLLREIDDAITLLQEEPKTGHKISRDRWPKEYKKASPALPNLHLYKLDSTHRMLYSIIKIPDAPPFVWIIDAMDYPRYKRLFGYD